MSHRTLERLFVRLLFDESLVDAMHADPDRALAGLDNFPLDRVVEMHVAGGSVASVDGFEYVEDGHLPEPIPDTWQIFEYALARATSLRAVCYECENNQPEACVSNFERLNRAFPPVGDAVLAG